MRMFWWAGIRVLMIMRIFLAILVVVATAPVGGQRTRPV
jgi:hypothetical protein